MATKIKNNILDKNDIEELAKFFDLLQKFDVQDKKAETEREDKLKD
jgi:hypothetical protein